MQAYRDRPGRGVGHDVRLRGASGKRLRNQRPKGNRVTRHNLASATAYETQPKARIHAFGLAVVKLALVAFASSGYLF